MSNLLDAAVRAARAAGDIIRQGYGLPHTVTLKGAINPVTEVDHAAEEVILRMLREASPGYAFLTEESGELGDQSAARWVIDPLDGTVNYSHHFPYFGTSIALERDGRTELGVVYDPLRDELFTAERGKGAFLNGAPIHASGVTKLAGSLIATGVPYDVWETGGKMAELTRLVRKIQTPRINGAAVLDLSYVACGRMEAYWDSGMSPWDVAAGGLLVEEAGGTLVLYGDRSSFTGLLMIASNSLIHAQLEAIVAREPE